MKIVIAGAGEVGTHLAKLLSREELDVVLIDNDSNKLAILDSNYNLMTVVGNPTSFSVLKEAGVASAGLFCGSNALRDTQYSSVYHGLTDGSRADRSPH